MAAVPLARFRFRAVGRGPVPSWGIYSNGSSQCQEAAEYDWRGGLRDDEYAGQLARKRAPQTVRSVLKLGIEAIGPAVGARSVPDNNQAFLWLRRNSASHPRAEYRERERLGHFGCLKQSGLCQMTKKGQRLTIHCLRPSGRVRGRRAGLYFQSRGTPWRRAFLPETAMSQLGSRKSRPGNLSIIRSVRQFSLASAGSILAALRNLSIMFLSRRLASSALSDRRSHIDLSIDYEISVVMWRLQHFQNI